MNEALDFMVRLFQYGKTLRANSKERHLIFKGDNSKCLTISK